MTGRTRRGIPTKVFIAPTAQNAPVTVTEGEIKPDLKVEENETKCEQVDSAQGVKKDAQQEPVVSGDFSADGDNTSDGQGEKKSSIFRKFFFGVRKKSSARERKMRQNKRLRRILIPKNALMALHEIKGIKMSDFMISPRVGGGFTAEVTVNNIQYDGYGSSKLSAKNSVCEKALRDLIISKMLQNPSKHNSTEQIDSVGIGENDGDDVQMRDVEDEENDVPMINLASFALYKLFSEWENEGFEVPEFRNHSSPNSNAQPSDKPKKSPTTRSDLPPNWDTMHPTTLLCMMRPGIAYTDLGCDGIPPNQTQKMGVVVDGEHFIGIGRSKKLARRDAACLACNKLFGTNFQNEI